jgi:hypothetical protein
MEKKGAKLASDRPFHIETKNLPIFQNRITMTVMIVMKAERKRREHGNRKMAVDLNGGNKHSIGRDDSEIGGGGEGGVVLFNKDLLWKKQSGSAFVGQRLATESLSLSIRERKEREE